MILSNFQEFNVNRGCRNNTNSYHLLGTATSPVLSWDVYTHFKNLIFKKFWLTKLFNLNIIMLILQTRHIRLPHIAFHVYKLIKKMKEKQVRNVLL